MPKANKQQINTALIKIKNTINDSAYGNFHLKKRDENQETIIKLGFLPEHVFEEVLKLTYRNYCSGPEQNISSSGSRKGSVWKFGKTIKQIEVYIKIHILPIANKNECICISFHESSKAMRYPYGC